MLKLGLIRPRKIENWLFKEMIWRGMINRLMTRSLGRKGLKGKIGARQKLSRAVAEVQVHRGRLKTTRVCITTLLMRPAWSQGRETAMPVGSKIGSPKITFLTRTFENLEAMEEFKLGTTTSMEGPACTVCRTQSPRIRMKSFQKDVEST